MYDAEVERMRSAAELPDVAKAVVIRGLRLLSAQIRSVSLVGQLSPAEQTELAETERLLIALSVGGKGEAVPVPAPVIVVTVSPAPDGISRQMFAAEFEGDPGSRTSGWPSERDALGALLIEEVPPGGTRRHGIAIKIHHTVKE